MFSKSHMEKIHFQFQNILVYLFLFQHSSLLDASSNYETPVKYLINCGSKSNVNDSWRTFLGDKKHNSGFSPGRRSQAVKDKNPSTIAPLLYQTARIYKNPSSYEFDILENGTYFVRLHFFAFDSEEINLADALFNVTTSKFLLLSNFGIQNTISSAAVVKEFLLNLNVSKFSIYFTPHETSFAFVNALEVFLAPPNITRDAALPIPKCNYDTHSGFLSDALNLVHRINVGGQTPYIDLFWRNWTSDNGFLHQNGSAKVQSKIDIKLDYYLIEKDVYAPELVYKTCKESDAEAAMGPSFANTTWRFNVSKNAKHLVRVHFCDIVSSSKNTVQFKLFIGRKFNCTVDTNVYSETPFYFDFVIDSDGLGYLEIGIRPFKESTLKKAFLNGLEIMELIKETNLNFPPDKPKHHQHLIVGLVVGFVFVVFLVGVGFSGLKYKRQKQVGIDPIVLCGGRIFCRKTRQSTCISSVPNCNLKLRMPFADILNATQNFDPELLIGAGGFGKVYKGTLRSGMKVAVKRSHHNHGQGFLEFQTEVMILSKIRHRHLVSLIGYCQEGSEMILVYEFMELGTLRDHLYDTGENNGSSSKPTKSKLSWQKRLEICIGSAKGLHYLHTGSEGGIIHRDVKSTNILLDEHYLAKVADFGLSRSGPLDSDHFSSGIRGSFGYLDPEYLTCLQFTQKSDVYSFGVVLLEVLCARPAIMNSTQMEEVNLVDWAMYWLKNDQIEKIVDPFLEGQVNSKSLEKFVEIAEKCLKRNGEERPTMYDVLWYLAYALQLQTPEVPIEPNEDTTDDVFLDSTVIRRFPSFGITDYENDEIVLIGDKL